MRKHWQVFIIFALATFLFVLADPFAYSHLNALPNQTGKDDTVCSHERAVCLDNHFIFWIENTEEVGDFNSAERAEEINKRIKKIADDSSIDINSLNVDNWQGAKVTIVRSPDTVIFTLTDNDVQATKSNIKDKEKLAYQYLEKIKSAIETYRKKRHFNQHFGWLGWLKRNFPLVATILLIIFISCLLIVFFRIIRHRIIRKYSRPQKSINSVFLFLINSFGRLIEVIVFLIILALISRLILIAFNINQEAFFVDTLTATDLKKLFEQTVGILQVIGLIFLLGILSLLLRWLSRKGQGTVVIPFEDTTGGKYNGKAIADSLVEELHRIYQIHLLSSKFSEYDVKLESVNLSPIAPKEDIESHLVDSGTVNISGINFSPGRLLLVLRHLWPFGGVNRVISGSIHELDSKTNLVGVNLTRLSLIVRLDDQNGVGIWKAPSEGSQTESLSALIRDMAYKVSFKLATNITAKNWKSFKFFTEGINNLYEYRSTQLTNLLKQAEHNCLMAKNFEFNYNKISDLFYALGVEYYQNLYQDKEGKEKAKRMFDLAIEVNPQNALAYNGRGNIYVRKCEYDSAIQEYNLAIKLDSKFAYPHNGLGSAYVLQGQPLNKAEAEYLEAIKLKPRFWKPHHNLGNLYSTMKRYDDAIKEFKKAINIEPYCQGHLGLGWNLFLKVATRNKPKPWTKKELENKQIQNQLIEAQNEIQIGLNLEKHKYWMYCYFLNLGVISLWLGKKEEACEYWKKGCDLNPDDSLNEINKKLYTYAKDAISSKISEPDLESKFKKFKDFLSSSDTARKKGLLQDALEDADILARLPQEYKPKQIDEIVLVLKSQLGLVI